MKKLYVLIVIAILIFVGVSFYLLLSRRNTPVNNADNNYGITHPFMSVEDERLLEKSGTNLADIKGTIVIENGAFRDPLIQFSFKNKTAFAVSIINNDTRVQNIQVLSVPNDAQPIENFSLAPGTSKLITVSVPGTYVFSTGGVNGSPVTMEVLSLKGENSE